MDIAIRILDIICAVIAACVFYKGIYTGIGFFCKAKVFPPVPMTRKYGVVIAARNEKHVIGLLVDSLMEQTYPQELYTIFVVADNCTDNTAEIAREHGATVYERHCPEKARKGWALEFLFEQIERDYGIRSFDGFFFFDADNVVANDYMEQMNNAFETGCDAVIGYRNTKNFDRNCISAHYGIHFMRSSFLLHRPRSRLGLTTHIAGTGYLLSSEMLKDGWHYSTLTEDTQATMDFTVQGKRIEYCEAAEFYDEQPYELKVMLRQRIRWAKGRLACFIGYGHRLVFGLFRRFPPRKACGNEQAFREANKPFANKSKSPWDWMLNLGSAITDIAAKLIRPIGRHYSCYDMFFYLTPNSVLVFIAKLLKYIVGLATALALGQILLRDISGWVLAGVGVLLGSAIVYVGNILIGLMVVVREWPHIHCAKRKMVWYLITWPLFDMLYSYLCIVSLFMRVKWKPIKHDEAISIHDLNEKKKEKVSV